MTQTPLPVSPNPVSAAMAAGLARLWVKFLPEIEQRMLILEATSKTIKAGCLSRTDREASHAAAHKLAGILGTFGLHRGTELARKAEHLLAVDVPASMKAELSSWIVELRALIEERKRPGTTPVIQI